LLPALMTIGLPDDPTSGNLYSLTSCTRRAKPLGQASARGTADSSHFAKFGQFTAWKPAVTISEHLPAGRRLLLQTVAGGPQMIPEGTRIAVPRPWRHVNCLSYINSPSPALAASPDSVFTELAAGLTGV
jgi:hypothetical protein